MRIEPHQGRFASRIGVSQGKLSSLETATREPKAEDLAAAAAAGVDIHYVLTGRRSESELLDEDASELLGIFLSLGPALKEALLNVARLVAKGQGDDPAAEAPATLHAPQREYHAAEEG